MLILLNNSSYIDHTLAQEQLHCGECPNLDQTEFFPVSYGCEAISPQDLENPTDDKNTILTTVILFIVQSSEV